MPDLLMVEKVTKAATLTITNPIVGDDSDVPTFIDDAKWGFSITGGADFNMPITVFHVTEGGIAERGGIKLGDTIVKINGIETKNMSLQQAQKSVKDSEDSIRLIRRKFEDDESVVDNEENEVVLESRRRRRPMEIAEQKLEAPKELVMVPQPERKVWHPVVWQQPPPPVAEEHRPGEEFPHKRIIRNIRRFFTDNEGNQELRKKYIEDMLLALPSASKT